MCSSFFRIIEESRKITTDLVMAVAAASIFFSIEKNHSNVIYIINIKYYTKTKMVIFLMKSLYQNKSQK